MSLVSVILPVYNTSLYIKEAIESILAQSHKNFELIIIDDRSTDNTIEVIKNINDPRITIIKNEKNLGRAGSDNKGVTLAKGDYIAKMDGDDICHPDRFKIQLDIFKNNPEINVVGSQMQNFGYSSYLNKYPDSPMLAKCQTLFNLPVGNPSIMLKADLFREKKFTYNESYRQSEDYEFFARYINELNIYNIQLPLIRYRTYKDSFKKNILDDRKLSAINIQRDLLKSWGLKFKEEEFKIHEYIFAGHNFDTTKKTLIDSKEWLLRLKNHNEKNKWFDSKTLDFYLSKKWFETCYNRGPKKTNTLKIFNKYNGLVGKKFNIPAHLKGKFLLKNLLDKK